jgi:hypothetical protein
MATGKYTGPGEISVHYADSYAPWSNSFDHVILYNFNFDGDELKPEHVEFLNRELIPFLKASGRKAHLEGYASQKGDAAYNQKLSERRVMAVLNHLMRQGVRETQTAGAQGFGELRSTSENDDDSRDRAVHIYIQPDRMPQRPAPSAPKRPAPAIPVPQITPSFPPPPPAIILPPIFYQPLPKVETAWRVVQEVYMKIKWVEGGMALPNPGSSSPFKSGQGKSGGATFPWVILNDRTTMGHAHFNALQEFTVEHKFRIATFDFLSLQNFTQQRLNVFVQVVNYTYTPAADVAAGPGFHIPHRAEDVLAIYATGTAKEPPK